MAHFLIKVLECFVKAKLNTSEKHFHVLNHLLGVGVAGAYPRQVTSQSQGQQPFMFTFTPMANLELPINLRSSTQAQEEQTLAGGFEARSFVL